MEGRAGVAGVEGWRAGVAAAEGRAGGAEVESSEGEFETSTEEGGAVGVGEESEEEWGGIVEEEEEEWGGIEEEGGGEEMELGDFEEEEDRLWDLRQARWRARRDDVFALLYEQQRTILAQWEGLWRTKEAFKDLLSIAQVRRE